MKGPACIPSRTGEALPAWCVARCVPDACGKASPRRAPWAGFSRLLAASTRQPASEVRSCLWAALSVGSPRAQGRRECADPCWASSRSWLAWGAGFAGVAVGGPADHFPQPLWPRLAPEVPISPHLRQHLLFSGFNSRPGGCERASRRGLGLPFPADVSGGRWLSAGLLGGTSVQVPCPSSWRASRACLNRDCVGYGLKVQPNFKIKPRFCFI